MFTKQSIITGESTQGEHEAAAEITTQGEQAAAEITTQGEHEAAAVITPQGENKEAGQKKSGELTFYSIEKVNCLEII